jgi:hypothetical protein
MFSNDKNTFNKINKKKKEKRKKLGCGIFVFLKNKSFFLKELLFFPSLFSNLLEHFCLIQ